jgi:hypothetical protein
VSQCNDFSSLSNRMYNSVINDVVRKGSSRMAIIGGAIMATGEDYLIEEGNYFDKDEIRIIRLVTDDTYRVVVRAGSVLLLAPAHDPANLKYAGEVRDVKEYIKYIKIYAPEDWVTKAAGNSLFISLLCREALAGTLDGYIK